LSDCLLGLGYVQYWPFFFLLRWWEFVSREESFIVAEPVFFDGSPVIEIDGIVANEPGFLKFDREREQGALDFRGAYGRANFERKTPDGRRSPLRHLHLNLVDDLVLENPSEFFERFRFFGNPLSADENFPVFREMLSLILSYHEFEGGRFVRDPSDSVTLRIGVREGVIEKFIRQKDFYRPRKELLLLRTARNERVEFPFFRLFRFLAGASLVQSGTLFSGDGL
jgi:hypothetical protein